MPGHFFSFRFRFNEICSQINKRTAFYKDREVKKIVIFLFVSRAGLVVVVVVLAVVVECRCLLLLLVSGCCDDGRTSVFPSSVP